MSEILDAKAKDIINTNESLALESFGIAIGVNLALALGYLLWFCVFRTRAKTIYQYRVQAKEVDASPLPESFFGWIKPLWNISDTEVLHFAGVDAMVFLKCMKFGLVYFSIISIYNICVIIPINYLGKKKEEGLRSLTISNLDKSDAPVFAAHIISVYLSTFIFIFMINVLYKKYTRLRLAFLQQADPHSYTIMIKGISKSSRNEQDLEKFLKFIHGDNSIKHVEVVKKCQEIQALVDKRANYQALLEQALEKYAKSKTQKRPMHRIGVLSILCCQGKVDSIRYYENKLNEYNLRVNRALDTQHLEVADSHTAFVTFSSLSDASKAAQCIHWPNSMLFRTEMAPAPKDVLWDNLEMSMLERSVRYMVVCATHVLMVMFWTIPVTFVQSIANYFTVPAVLDGFLPAVVLKLFIIILPHICMFLAKMEGLTSKSEVEFSQLRKLYVFFLINIFLVSIFSGSILESLHEIIEKPSEVFKLLGDNIPNTAGFFLNYVLILTFGGGFFLELSQIDIWFMAWFNKTFIARSVKERERAYEAWSFDYGRLYAQLLLVFSIGITFSVISPVILPFCVAYCAVGYMISKHQFVFVHKKTYESGGLAFPIIIRRSIVAMVICQLTIMGVLLLKGSIGAYFIIPLPILTCVFYLYESKIRDQATNFMPLVIAKSLDEQRNLVDSQMTVAASSSSLTSANAEVYKENISKRSYIEKLLKMQLDSNGENAYKESQLPVFIDAESYRNPCLLVERYITANDSLANIAFRKMTLSKMDGLDNISNCDSLSINCNESSTGTNTPSIDGKMGVGVENGQPHNNSYDASLYTPSGKSKIVNFGGLIQNSLLNSGHGLQRISSENINNITLSNGGDTDGYLSAQQSLHYDNDYSAADITMSDLNKNDL